MENKYTDKFLLEHILNKYAQLGRMPKENELEHREIIKKRFENYKNLLNRSHLFKKRQKLSKEEYKKVILNWVKEHKRCPTQSDFLCDPALPHPQALKKKFNCTLSKILKDLNLEIDKSKNT